ncbi:V-set and immunoglobulin domain-containing protein 10-like [Nerophis ophidion]|uniref:V-set and immunoglobulin domain-containing protein 10-like n=1 Tax=Nerophis ophidion TaxID=159077 RepID=UPI002AE02A16|nr:V-set and immunoglobulin domain-containing protein 10-like [Nerophis ophidion]
MRTLTSQVLVIIFGFALPGGHCELLVSALGPTRVDTTAGSQVTLAVSFSGAPDPAFTWFKGPLPVVTWTIGSELLPDIAQSHREVLRLEPNGSLTFLNVPSEYSSIYTLEMTKSGLGTASLNFTLRVFETFRNVSVRLLPETVTEGSQEFTLQYHMLHGVVEQQLWFFHGRPIQDHPRYSVQLGSLTVQRPNRNDTGRYVVSLNNPFSSETAHIDVTVLYGPDEPRVQVRPAQDFYLWGDSLTLSCRADGDPEPTAEWTFGGQTVSPGQTGVISLTHVQTTQGGDYTCTVHNQITGARRHKSITVVVYERPRGSPLCWLRSEDQVRLQYGCRWSGGTPPARLHFPDLTNSSGLENFTLTVNASNHLDGAGVTCVGVHPAGDHTCNVTASSPKDFLPAVGTGVDSEGKIVVSIHCVSEASPPTVVSWYRGGQAVVGDGAEEDIGDDTRRLRLRHRNVSVLLLHNYTCTCSNPLGSRSRDIHLQGPAIAAFALFPHEDGTIVTLTWEVPPTSIVTGFDIQMSGPDLPGANRKRSPDTYRTIFSKPGSARSADILELDPKSTYRFRVVPRALMSEGPPTAPHRIGPGEGLSGAAIAGIAAGIPCSILFLLLACGLVYFLVRWSGIQSRQTRYPVSRAAEKVVTPQTQAPSPPAYNRLHQTPSSLSVAPPSFVPPPPVRVATTV